MKMVVIILAGMILLGGVAFGGRADFGTPPARVGESVSANTDNPMVTVLKVKLSIWLGLDLFGGSDEPDGPQLDDGKHTGRQLVVPITRDDGFEFQH